MKDIILYCIEGYSASSRKEEKTLSAVVDEIVLPNINHIYDYKEVKSRVFFNRYKKMKDDILFQQSMINRKRKSAKLFIIGKSMGGYVARKLFKKLLPDITYFEKVCLLTIDAHAPLAGWGTCRKSITNPSLWKSPSRKLFNIYQTNKYPKGIQINGVDAEYEMVDKKVDHWNIINHEQTKKVMKEGLEWLI